MTRRAPGNLAASVHQRLLNRARATRRPFNELLQYYAMERFLYRLSQTAHAKRFILKGALLFAGWGGPASRPTKDIDLLGKMQNDLGVVAKAIREACTREVTPDGLTFDAASVEATAITEDADYAGVRVRFQGALAQARVSMQVDVGFGDVVVPAARMVEYPGLLDFPAPRLLGYSRESTIAEKLHAMVKLELLNSRMKDFYDVWRLAHEFGFRGRELAEAIQKTFARRNTAIPAQVVALTPSFAREPTKVAQWTAFVRRSRLAGAPESLPEVIGTVAAFLTPVVSALSQGQPFEMRWKAGGPWQA